MMNILKAIPKKRLFWPFFVLGLILLFDLVVIPGFFSIEFRDGNLFGRLVDILNRGSVYIILAVGMTLVIATGGIDISVGSVLAISGAIVATMLGAGFEAQIPMALCIIVAVLVCIAIGCWNGFLVSKLGVQPVVATLIIMVAGRGIAQLVTKGQIPITNYLPFTYVAGFIPGIPLPTSVFIAAAVVIFALLMTKKTALGIFIESIGINPKASRFSGIKVSKLIFLAYAFAGLCAGIAGLIVCSQIKAADANNAGLLFEMDAILAVAIGGTSLMGGKFSIGASVIGALILQTLTTTLYALGVSPLVLPVVKALVVIAICLLQSEEFRKIFFSFIFIKERGVKNAKA
jgi:galactofuranose transport system permease protein